PLFLALGAWVWTWAVRLGPPAATPTTTEADAVDYASALARLYQQAGARRRLARTLARGFLGALTGQLRLRRNALPAEVLSAWRQHDPGPSGDRLQGLLRGVAELRKGDVTEAQLLDWSQGFDQFIREMQELEMLAMLVGGHVLLEGVPGTAKTLMARTLARLLALECKRVQFTPDLMPSDVVGTNVFNLQTSRFEFRPGPVFTDILVADEINRTPPKTQSALLEVMEEKNVTIDGLSHPLSELFTVVATQNPIEYEGTYRLPEAQL